METNVKLTCPNNECNKVIAKPLTTLNLQQSSKKSYNACPYCLTEITENESKNPQTKNVAEIDVLEDKTSQNLEKLSDCKHYFGYMSEKEHKEQMPEECIMCSKIIECMAKENGSVKVKTQIKKIP